MENLYEILQCNKTDPVDVIKQSYQRLVRELHPDKVNNSSMTDSEKLEMKDRFLAVGRAWKILSDARLRREFDVRWQERCLAQEGPVQEEVCLEDFDVDEERNLRTYDCRCGGCYKLTDMDTNLRMDVVCCDTCSLNVRVNYDSDMNLNFS